MSPEKMMGEGAKSVPDYDGRMQALLAQTIFQGNAGLEHRCQVPSKVHNLLRKLTGDETPTNQHALKLYIEGTEKLRGAHKPNLSGMGEKAIHQLENYLVALGILEFPYTQACGP